MTTLNNSENLIEKVGGIEKAREIVEGAPSWAVFWVTRNEYHISMLSFPNMTGQESYLISDLRTAIAEHDSNPSNSRELESDHVTDITNHISPSTKVINHG